MIDHWREILYPLGYLPALAFGARFIVQWLKSEKRGKSIVTPIFWKLSLIGNVLLMIHAFIQMQYHVCTIQIINGVISWRNLNLMEDHSKHLRTRSVILFLFCSLVLTTLAFALQDAWFRIPSNSWNSDPSSLGYIWHLFGFAGLVLFNSRFWIQWWYAEKTQKSVIGRSFWWISLAGAFCSLLYFIRIKDPVNVIGPGIGIIPYIRNLMLLSKSHQKETVAEQT